MNIGKNIKALRIKKGETQEKLAEYLKVSFQAISKWETDTNTPDISLLPLIAEHFGVSIDTLFANDISIFNKDLSCIKDDGIVRIVQYYGNKVLKIDEIPKENIEPIEIRFPRNCNNKTQYFNVEVFGNVYCDTSINGDVICYGNLQCHEINGNIKNCEGSIDCFLINAQNINVAGNINKIK